MGGRSGLFGGSNRGGYRLSRMQPSCCFKTWRRPELLLVVILDPWVQEFDALEAPLQQDALVLALEVLPDLSSLF